MSDLPRFENVDLTPTWDDVDPAALDFGVGATEVDVDAVEVDPQPVSPRPEPEAEPVPADEPEAEVEVEGFEPPTVQEVEDAPDDGAYWESSDQFDGGGILAESVPDGFDDLT